LSPISGSVSSRPKKLGRVERTNALKLEEFISAYVPTNYLEADGAKVANTFDIYSAQTLTESDLELCFNLIKETSLTAYESSSTGWSPTKKRKEMRLPDMHYIILRRRPAVSDDANDVSISSKGEGVHCHREGILSNDCVLGFLSFMVTYEDGKEVIYCYEIHLSSEVRGQGMGKHLMTLFEQIGRNIGLEKVMLTVFVSNTHALRFYDKLGYVIDEYSPEPRKLRNGTIKEPDYRILSKVLRM
jgi:ribosomal protein S18 acetylase RimI-like enzyme